MVEELIRLRDAVPVGLTANLLQHAFGLPNAFVEYCLGDTLVDGTSYDLPLPVHTYQLGDASSTAF